MSELLPHLGGVADELCVIRSMHCTNPRHGGAVLEWHTGSDTFIRPSLGSWLSYGLGNENANLPSYITICQALSQGGANNYSAGFLPAVHQGTPLGFDGTSPARARFPFITARKRPEVQEAEVRMLRKLAELNGEPLDAELNARIRSFELAFRMQREAPAAQDLSQETRETKRLYGLDNATTRDFGIQCLLARRFSERGVRFVQCNSNGWDHHNDIKNNMRQMCRRIDKPVAGLLHDLKRRGLLDETLVIWGGEFGRTPTAESGTGRDHNPNGFTMWLAGGGVRAGLNYGRTDEYGYFAVENKVHFHDLHATVLHLLGLDHQRLTYRYAGRDFRLTDIHGEVVRDLLA